ncbi:MAG: sigma 54-interacting transcriptional regulator [Dethiobacteria bacterium]|jgi:PAS domain S-box-containing protein
MEKTRIVMISPLPELTRLAQQVSKELNFEMEIVEAFLDEGVELGKRAVQSGADVIISRGPTGVILKKELPIPVILIQITNFDIIQALYHARQLGRKIAYFDYIKRKDFYDFSNIAQILSLEELRLFFYRDEKELDEQIKRAHAEGIEVVVASGVCVVRMAQEQGMQGVMVFTSREAIVESLQWAKDLVAIRQKDREKAEYFKTIIEHMQSGAIAVNYSNEVVLFNPVAEELFKVSGKELLGKKIKDIHIPQVQKIFQSLNLVENEIQKINGKQVVFNRIPILMGHEFLGTVMIIQNIHELQNLEGFMRSKLYAAGGFLAQHTFQDIIGTSDAIRGALERARKFALTDSTVLITGESGTGKDLFAHSIHAASPRREGPFVVINCVNSSEDLLEGELFGYEEGAFSGTKKGGKAGLFELAHGGTLFIDEISALSSSLQLSLLRILQQKVVRRLGGERLLPVNVRVIAATSRFLPAEIKKGKFREDLFFHLNVLNLHIPSLRERKSDIPLLMNYFAEKYRGDNRETADRFPDSIIRFLSDYDWPDNVRELENFMNKYVILSEGSKDSFRLMEELVDELYRFREDSKIIKGDEDNSLTINIGTLEYMEQQIIKKLSQQTDIDKKDLASLLGISRTTLWKKLKALHTANQYTVQ